MRQVDRVFGVDGVCTSYSVTEHCRLDDFFRGIEVWRRGSVMGFTAEMRLAL